MRISGTLPFSVNNGYGIRYVIFTQGCIHKCKDCQNQHTWDIEDGMEVSIHKLLEDIIRRKHVNGITISGGEPFLQQNECVDLIKRLPPNLDVWIYTGFLYEEIQYTELADMADYIVDGLFEVGKQIDGKIYGSSNQRIINIKTGGLL